MRNLLLLLILLLAGLAVALYLKPELRLQLEDELRELPGGSAIPPTESTLYKWQDDRGIWQLTDRPPTDSRPYETHQIDHATNVVPAVEVADEER